MLFLLPSMRTQAAPRKSVRGLVATVQSQDGNSEPKAEQCGLGHLFHQVEERVALPVRVKPAAVLPEVSVLPRQERARRCSTTVPWRCRGNGLGP
jgi:hypothetical protein